MSCNSEIEKLYSPSQWSKRSDVINVHIGFAKQESENVRNSIPCQLNISYGDADGQKFDIYGTDLPDDAPIFIFIHGGYWQQLNKNISSYVVPAFYKNQFKTIIIGYTLCPLVTVVDIVKEIETAIKKCIDYAKSNGATSIYISGYSAGAQLISALFSSFYPSLPEEDRHMLKAAILCCGIYDLTPLIETYINKPLKLTYDDAKLLSPMSQLIDDLKMTVYIVVGEYDSPAFLKQSQTYFEKIRTKCNHCCFKIIQNVDHFSIVEQYNDENYELVKFILELENK